MESLESDVLSQQDNEHELNCICTILIIPKLNLQNFKLISFSVHILVVEQHLSRVISEDSHSAALYIVVHAGQLNKHTKQCQGQALMFNSTITYH